MLDKNDVKNIDFSFLKDSNSKRIQISNFSHFTYATRWHWQLFDRYDEELFGKKLNLDEVDLKRYQDLLVFTFIKDYIPEGSRILDVGGGISRLLSYFSQQYECWNIDKLEGIGNGPKGIGNRNYKLVKDYMGNFNEELPDNYFDLVFSVSALEHVPQEDSVFFQNIIDDINRVLRPGGYSLHLFDIVFNEGKIRNINKLIYHMFLNQKTINSFIHPNKIFSGYDLFFLSEMAYNKIWKKVTKKSYQEFGMPTSVNILWQKSFYN